MGRRSTGGGGGRAAVPVVADARGIALLLAGVLLLGTLGALFDPNLGALVPDLVEPERVQQITGLLDLTGRIARIAGPASIGVLLLFVSEVQLFALNGATFALSAVALHWLARRYATSAGEAAERPRSRVRSSVPAGPVLREHPRVALAIGLHGAALFCSAVTAIGMPAVLATRYGAGAAVYGLVTAAVGVGALLGNPLASNRRSGGWLTVYCGAWALQGGATACMAARPAYAAPARPYDWHRHPGYERHSARSPRRNGCA
ncbi:MFS transporter [Streptomyces sp. NPDC059650]|uniref:MFS transporter n=1 Tax=Streptomyces sp. NPDC059650 TaxID=3346896 RepID=UPI0036859F2E